MYFESIGDTTGVGALIDFFNYGGRFCQLWLQLQGSGVEVEEVEKELLVHHAGVSACRKYRIQPVGLGRKPGINDIVFAFKIHSGGLPTGSSRTVLATPKKKAKHQQ
jgi:hypothetical protein